MLRICFGIDMPSFFSVSANAAVIRPPIAAIAYRHQLRQRVCDARPGLLTAQFGGPLHLRGQHAEPDMASMRRGVQ